MSASLKQPVQMTVPEFLAWCPVDDGQRWELVDGVPRAMAPAKIGHGAIQSELAALIRNHLLERRSPCTVVTAPGIMPRVRGATNLRVPDLGVTCTRIGPTDATLPDPVLVIEILSPSNQAETWANVWTYTTIPSMREILVVHQVMQRAELLRRDAGGDWPAEPLPVTDGQLALDSIGFAVPLAAVYRTAPPLPPTRQGL
ncbi:MAG: Uma2 family endonuclease [Acetobacteraceae bacterium]|nr:Uma2 family endonuclease [Acetobacteraceae bacterium]